MASILDDKIALIQILDLLSMSILLPSVPPTILKSGGTLLHLGAMMSLITAARLISTEVYKELRKIIGPRQLLKYSLITSTVLNVSLIFTFSHQTILLNRITYFLVYQVPKLCGELANHDEKDQNAFKSSQQQRFVVGLIGCALVGCCIDVKGGFYILVAIASIISITAVVILFQLDVQKGKEKRLSTSDAISVIPKTFRTVGGVIRNVDINFANWDALLIKSLLIINEKVVFILFVVLVIFVFGGHGAMVSATSAHQTIVMFSIANAMDSLKSQANLFGNPKEILEKSLMVCALCALIQVFSPTHTFYLFMFVPFALSRTFAEAYYVDVFEIKKNQKLRTDIETVTVITDLVAPWFIGLLFYLLKHNAYRILTVIPIVAIYYIVKNKNYRSLSTQENIRQRKRNNVTNENNKDK